MKKYLPAIAFCLLLCACGGGGGGDSAAPAPAPVVGYTGASPTWTTSPDYASVSSCVTAASAGDTINVTVGDGAETWSSALNISKPINLVGPGRDSLVITLGVSGAYTITTGVLSGGSISGFEFYTTSAESAIDIRGTGWRIHNNRYRNTKENDLNGVFVSANGSNTTTTPEGLIDNNDVINGKVIVTGGGNFTNESTHWASASTIGTDKSVYIEDNVFSMTWNGGSNCTDSNRSGRYVFRYNTVTQAYVMAHDLQAAGERGPREWEVYGNTFNSFGNASWAAMAMRGGTGHLFYNDTSSTVDYNYSVLFQIHRATDSVPTGGLCDGSSIWDENTVGQSGWLCRDQLGAGRDASQWSAYTVAGPVQEKVPVYVWGIYNDGALQSPAIYPGTAPRIQANRDYYTHNAAFDGTSGVGCGTLAARPATCTVGVAYWATNQSCTNLTGMVGANPATKIVGKLYKCTALNTWSTDGDGITYEPYPYPHPLRN